VKTAHAIPAVNKIRINSLLNFENENNFTLQDSKHASGYHGSAEHWHKWADTMGKASCSLNPEPWMSNFLSKKKPFCGALYDTPIATAFGTFGATNRLGMLSF
jgi:hypothetical protein